MVKTTGSLDLQIVSLGHVVWAEGGAQVCTRRSVTWQGTRRNFPLWVIACALNGHTIINSRFGPGAVVRIALQLDDGSRLQDTFCSGQTLWELLSHFGQTR
uniref:Uncharacterized protein n=1 Tax=Sciurus vulgaris TaxID=55149 RepID=A0A8D2JN04_SCIVU